MAANVEVHDHAVLPGCFVAGALFRTVWEPWEPAEGAAAARDRTLA